MSRQPRIIAPIWVGLASLFCSPVLGCVYAAFNWMRAGHTNKAVLYAVGAVVAASACALGPLYLPIASASAIGLYADQERLARQHSAERIPWIYPVLLGTIVFIGIAALPTVFWIIVGDQAIKPGWMRGLL